MASKRERRRINKRARKQAKVKFFADARPVNVISDESEQAVPQIEVPADDFGVMDVINKFRERQETIHEDIDTDVPMDAPSDRPLSKKQLRRQRAALLPDLKARVLRPDLVELTDVTSPDPDLLLALKSVPGAVPVPRHWADKQRYLAKRATREMYRLPPNLDATGVAKVRAGVLEHERNASVSQLARERVRPKVGRMFIDYETLSDAFYKSTYYPTLTRPGDVFYEGKPSHTMKVIPGRLSATLRAALGMKEGDPPPWLKNMQHGYIGPDQRRQHLPPSYPDLRVPNLNAVRPDGTQGGKWGYRPRRQDGTPLLADPLGTDAQAQYMTRPTERWSEYRYREAE